MEKDEPSPHLSRITTQWTLIFQAHGGTASEVALAQAALMTRYAGAVHRYLLATLRDAEAAAELDQEFALRFLRGDFHRADPGQGRFRDFIKRSLRNLMIDYQRRRRVRAVPLVDDIAAPAGATAADEFDRQFLESWRKELIARAWDGLAGLEERTGQPYYAVLKLRVDHPELRSEGLAERLSARLGRPITAGGLRQALRRSRDRFVRLLLEEVATSMGASSEEDLERELIDLGLIEYCRPALKRRDRESGRPPR